jgi:hypothetical protein
VDSTGVVLLCAEDDDLELVRWVHAARNQGLQPEVVTGVERDDAPLLEAIEQTEDALFVVLRSENLGADRMRAIKATFARHHRPTQRLVALRLDGTAEAAIERIAAEIHGGLRARSEASLLLAIEGSMTAAIDAAARRNTPPPTKRLRATTGPLPQAQLAAENAPTTAHVPMRALAVPQQVLATDATPIPAVIDHRVGPPGPDVDAALSFARHAHEHETTDRHHVDDHTEAHTRMFSPMREPKATSAAKRSRATQIGMVVGTVIGCACLVTWLLAVTEPDTEVRAAPAGDAARVTVPASTVATPVAAPAVRDIPAPIIAAPEPVIEIDDDEPAPDPSVEQRARTRSKTREHEVAIVPPAAAPATAPVATPLPAVSDTAVPEPVAVAGPPVQGEMPNEPAPLDITDPR